MKRTLGASCQSCEATSCISFITLKCDFFQMDSETTWDILKFPNCESRVAGITGLESGAAFESCVAIVLVVE